MPTTPTTSPPTLRRSLTLGHAVLYGIGVTVGAGIYVLIADTAARAGMHAPLAFVVTALLVGLTGATLAELGSRFPVAAGEAEYVRRGFASERMGSAIGVLVIAMAVVSAATISVGAAGYIGVFVPLPATLVIAGVVVAMGAIATRDVKESVTFAGVMTLVELAGLVLIIGAGLAFEPKVFTELPALKPPALDAALWSGIATAAMLAVFAFVGFEGIVNIAEEMKEPRRTLPAALFLTLAITTLLYVLVTWVSLATLGVAALAQSKAPLADVFERLTGLPRTTMSAIAIVATLNGIVVNLIMASRVTYGLARGGRLAPWLARLSPTTGTPVAATLLATIATLVFALALPIAELADISARITLVVFALVNAALVLVKRRDATPPSGIFVCPAWVPWAGALSCAAFIAADIAIAVSR